MNAAHKVVILDHLYQKVTNYGRKNFFFLYKWLLCINKAYRIISKESKKVRNYNLKQLASHFHTGTGYIWCGEYSYLRGTDSLLDMFLLIWKGKIDIHK